MNTVVQGRAVAVSDGSSQSVASAAFDRLPAGPVRSLWWAGDALRLLDQTKLPLTEAVIACRDAETVARAIKTMQVRGAPAIGVSAAYGFALGLLASPARGPTDVMAVAESTRQLLASTRPTAQNLFWALDQQWQVVVSRRWSTAQELGEALLANAHRLAETDEAVNRRLGAFGADLTPIGARVLTHCNAGALACVTYGTALGVIRAAHGQGKIKRVWVDETRPLLQGARLTAWELHRDGIPVTLLVDAAAAQLMRRGEVDLIVVGADRVAANGDTANKIGTYGLSVLARAHGVPLYIAAPWSTIDLALATGDAIPIEERGRDEVSHAGGARVSPLGIDVVNPAFDVTPHQNITAIITELGVVRPPFGPNLAALAPRPEKG